MGNWLHILCYHAKSEQLHTALVNIITSTVYTYQSLLTRHKKCESVMRYF